jgi:hypothetical protein
MSSSRLLDKRINYSLNDIIRVLVGKVRVMFPTLSQHAETPLDRLQQRMLALVRFKSIRDANSCRRRAAQLNWNQNTGAALNVSPAAFVCVRRL